MHICLSMARLEREAPTCGAHTAPRWGGHSVLHGQVTSMPKTCCRIALPDGTRQGICHPLGISAGCTPSRMVGGCRGEGAMSTSVGTVGRRLRACSSVDQHTCSYRVASSADCDTRSGSHHYTLAYTPQIWRKRERRVEVFSPRALPVPRWH